jgi:hypothetical protein
MKVFDDIKSHGARLKIVKNNLPSAITAIL